MTLLRILIIGLLVYLALQLVARLAAELGRRQPTRRTPPRQTGSRQTSPRRPQPPKRLVACPICGDYFEPGHGLRLPARGAGGKRLIVCSEACRTRHTAGGDRT